MNLQGDGISINNLDPVRRGTFIQARTHRIATARGLTGNKLAARRQRQEARRQAEEIRIRTNEETYSQLGTPASQDPLNDTQFTTISVIPTRPVTPPPPQRAIPIRTPTTAERPRPRRVSTESLSSPPQASPDKAPTSTAPPEMGRGKRKRPHTAKYQEAKQQGDIAESQEAHKARQG